MAAEIQSVRHVEHAEENRLAPGDLLVADADIQRPVVVLEEQRRQIDHVVAAGPFERVRPRFVLDVVLEVVRVLIDVADRVAVRLARAVFVVPARIEDRAHLGHHRPVAGKMRGGIELRAELLHVEGGVIALADVARHHVVDDERRASGSERRRAGARHGHAVEAVAVLVEAIRAAGADRAFRSDETADLRRDARSALDFLRRRRGVGRRRALLRRHFGRQRLEGPGRAAGGQRGAYRGGQVCVLERFHVLPSCCRRQHAEFECLPSGDADAKTCPATHPRSLSRRSADRLPAPAAASRCGSAIGQDKRPALKTISCPVARRPPPVRLQSHTRHPRRRRCRCTKDSAATSTLARASCRRRPC